MSAATTAGSGWDAHGHLFGPYDHYPLAGERSYSPPEATAAQYLAHLARLGLSNGVLVQPSAYGADHRLLLETLQAQPQLRGVMVTHPGALPTLAGLHAQGVRALRFSQRSGAGQNFAGSASLADLQALAPAMADAGLHAELWTDCQALPALAAVLRQLPCPVVIDHMGGFDVAAGPAEPGFQTLLRLVGEGRTWVKLCAYRNLGGRVDDDAGAPFHTALLRAGAQRLVWGSDWPHLRVVPAPDALALLAQFRRWTDSPALAAQILQDNAQALYG